MARSKASVPGPGLFFYFFLPLDDDSLERCGAALTSIAVESRRILHGPCGCRRPHPTHTRALRNIRSHGRILAPFTRRPAQVEPHAACVRGSARANSRRRILPSHVNSRPAGAHVNTRRRRRPGDLERSRLCWHEICFKLCATSHFKWDLKHVIDSQSIQPIQTTDPPGGNTNDAYP